MSRQPATVLREQDAECAYVLFIDGLPYAFSTEHTNGALLGRGPGSWATFSEEEWNGTPSGQIFHPNLKTLVDPHSGLTGTATGTTYDKDTDELIFDGSSHVLWGNVADLTSKPFTVCLWFTADDLSGTHSLFAYGLSDGAFAQITSTGLVRFVVNYDSGDDLRVDSVSGLVEAGERVFIALVTDGTTSASGMKIYVNGAPAATSFTQDATGTPRSLTGDWLIGRNSASFATGRIADFRTFDSALSPAQVAAIYARGPNPGREVLPGLILPSSLQLGDRDPGDGSLRKTSATFQVVDYGGRVSKLFQSEGQDFDLLEGRIPAGTSNIADSQSGPGGTTISVHDRYIATEKIGPTGERRQYPALPAALVGPQHLAGVAAPGVVAPAIKVTDAPLEHYGRLVTLYRIYKDKWVDGVDGWVTWKEAHDAGDLVWWGTLRGATEVTAGRVWSLGCFGPESLLSKQLGQECPDKWFAFTPELTLEDDERGFAVSFLAYPAEADTKTRYFKSQIFANKLTSTNKADLIDEINGYISDCADGSDVNLHEDSEAFNDWEEVISPNSYDMEADAGLDTEGFWVRRRKIDQFEADGGLWYLARVGVMNVTMHHKAWNMLGFDPISQHHLFIGESLHEKETDISFSEPPPTYLGFEVPGPDYYTGSFNTHALANMELVDKKGNDGHRRYYKPFTQELASTLEYEGGQVLRIHENNLYVRPQNLIGRTSKAKINGTSCDSARLALLKLRWKHDTEDEVVERYQPVRLAWVNKVGMESGFVDEAGGTHPAVYVDAMLDPRAFGFPYKPIKKDRTIVSTGENRSELMFLNALNVENANWADRLPWAMLQLLLSTGTGTGWDDTLDNSPMLAKGSNALGHFGQMVWGDDLEIADLGAAVPKQLVQDAENWAEAFDTLPGGKFGPLCRGRVAWSGIRSTGDIFKEITHPRWLGWSLHGKKYGLRKLGNFSPEDAEVVIRENDLHGEPGDPTSVHPRQTAPFPGFLDRLKLSYAYNLAENKTDKERITDARDPGARARAGEFSREITDRFLLDPAVFRSKMNKIVGTTQWWDHFDELWGDEVAGFLARPHYTVSIRVKRVPGQDLMVGTRVRITNPWPWSGEEYGITNVAGEVTKCTFNPQGEYYDVDVFCHAGQADAAYFAWSGKICCVDGAVLTFYGDEDYLNTGDGGFDPMRGAAEPGWSDHGGSATITVFDDRGAQYGPYTVVSVNAANRTITLNTAPTLPRDRDKWAVFQAYDGQVAEWVKRLHSVVCLATGKHGNTPTKGKPLQ